MQSIIVLCILSSGGFLTQAQLNYEGNPLTENTEYTAQESEFVQENQFSDRNARRDYQRFEIADGRTITASRGQFAASPIDPLATQETEYSSSNEDHTKNELPSKPWTRESIPIDNGSQLIRENQSKQSNITSKVNSEHTEANTLDSSLEDFPKASIIQTAPEAKAEARQLREYPIQSSQTLIDQSAVSQELSPAYYPSSRTYKTPEQSSEMRNFASDSQTSSSINQASGQALSQFLNSRTPEESNIALQNYLQMRENSARGAAQQSAGLEQNVNQQESVPFDGVTQENLGLRGSQQEIIQAHGTPVVSLNDPAQFGYASAQQYQQHPQRQHQHRKIPSPRWNQIGFQSRRDALQAGPGMRRPSRFRGPMAGRIRGNPWAQSRIGPGPIYHHKGPIYNGPPGPPSGLPGPWQPPVDVIYTRPPNFANHVSSLPSNPPVPYEDASKWFPDADSPPPQKDVYYSQLYAQSYDPHYYNYIAKTGKIKPWLYGKLGKHEEKGIWWELFSGFKNHGMKNMMNPMFLLGMTIPTLTFMLTALVQKRSLGRELAQLPPDVHTPEEYIEKYEQQIREALLAYDKQLKERIEANKEEGDKSW